MYDDSGAIVPCEPYQLMAADSATQADCLSARSKLLADKAHPALGGFTAQVLDAACYQPGDFQPQLKGIMQPHLKVTQ